MLYAYGDMLDSRTWQLADGTPIAFKPSAIVLTTNGFVKRTGDAVMGRGIAKQAADRWPKLPLQLGQFIKDRGNIVGVIAIYEDIPIISFPVKAAFEKCNVNKDNVVSHMQERFKVGQMVPGWACKARQSLIIRSAKELSLLATNSGWNHVILPRPGCGAGELSWEEIQVLLEPILDSGFWCFTWK
jgi:hypothetical protein